MGCVFGDEIAMKRFQSRGASTKIHDAGRGVIYMLISCRYTSFVKDSNSFILMMEKREIVASRFIAELSTFKCFVCRQLVPIERVVRESRGRVYVSGAIWEMNR